MKVGDRVTVVHGEAPTGTSHGEVLAGPRVGHAERVVWLVRLVSGAEAWFDEAMLDAGHVSLGPGRHRVGDPETARMAAEAVEERLTEHQWAVLASLIEAGPSGLLDHDHEQRNGLIQTSAGKRRVELVRLGLVEWTGRRRPSPSGQQARVWAVTARGVAVYQHHQRGAA